MFVVYEGKKIEVPKGSTGKDLAEILNLREPSQALAMIIEEEIKDLSSPLPENAPISFLSFEDPKGKEVFWHTSAHVLAQAILRLWPDAKPTIGPPIEQGFYYDFANLELSEEEFPKIEKEIKKILSENFKPERVVFSGKAEALQNFAHNSYKQELIESFDEESVFTAYRQGEFFDLCRGPHLPSLGKIKAFKILKTSGAYWRGDAKKEMLTRLYAISFPSKEQLKSYLHMLEEAKKRDHRLLGAKLDLFSFNEYAPAMAFIHPKGMKIWNHLIQFWRDLHTKAGYVEILTPQLMSKQLWELSGHWDHYWENMFISEDDKHHYAVKPMNCPGCMLYYRSHSHSYRELPLRVAELGHVHRKEPSGALNGMFRVQSFHQDDAHIFMKPEDIKQEIINVLHLVDQLYKPFGLNYKMELSTRPEKEKTIGSDEEWERATKGLQEALDTLNVPYRVNEGDGAFYGPKIDLHIEDALGRTWQCGTIQLDMALPQKFELVYMDKDGQEKRPVMIHRAIFGSVERFFGIIIEHFAGKFPLWLSPLPIRIIPVADRHLEYAQFLQKQIEEADLICDIDKSQESVSKKIRNAQLLKINYMLTVGDQEVEHQTITLRTRDNVVHGQMQLADFLCDIKEEKFSRSLVSVFAQKAENISS